MPLEYVVAKRVFGFDETQAEKYVAKSVRSGRVSFTKTCAKVSRLCGVHRKIVDLVVSGLVDMMADDIDDGKSVQRKILFYPGKIFKNTLDEMSVTRRALPDTDYTDGSDNSGKPDSGDDGKDDNGEAPDPTV